MRLYYQWSIDAYKATKYQEYLTNTIKANICRPNHPVLAYNLASAYAVNQQKVKAVDALKNYLAMNASLEYLQDSDFDNLQDYRPFIALESYVEDRSKKISTKTVFKVDQKEDHFESITYIAKSESFLMGSINSRKIIEVWNNSKRVLLENQPLMFSVMGLDFDQKTQTLWACTAALPQMNGYHDSLLNQSTVLAIDLKSGTIKQSFEVPDAILGDIIVLDDCSVLISDGLHSRVYQISKGKLKILTDLGKNLFNLQGIAQIEDKLYLSDYITGLYTLDMNTRELSKIKSNNLYSEKGTDGLLAYDEHLICLQNGTNPKRVFSLSLNTPEVKVIAQNETSRGEPTQGVIVGSTLYYIANSAWDAYDDQNKYLPQKAYPMEIRQFDLKENR